MIILFIVLTLQSAVFRAVFIINVAVENSVSIVNDFLKLEEIDKIFVTEKKFKKDVDVESHCMSNTLIGSKKNTRKSANLQQILHEKEGLTNTPKSELQKTLNDICTESFKGKELQQTPKLFRTGSFPFLEVVAKSKFRRSSEQCEQQKSKKAIVNHKTLEEIQDISDAHLQGISFLLNPEKA
ncbi:hypothetical protein HK096_009594, partial [Nowakowskiella sp. JEL0078]